MKSIFNFEGPFFSFFSRVADLLLLNLLFIICSLPIVTIGASATAMYYVTLKMVKDEESYIFKSFFKSFKQNFLQATGIWLMILAVSVVLASDYRIVTNEELSALIASKAVINVIMVATMVMTIFVACITVYVFPILAKFDNSVKNTIKNAFLMSVRHLPKTVLLILIPVIPAVIMYFDMRLSFIILFVFSLAAYFSSKILVKIFEYYIPQNDEGTISGEQNEET